MPVVYHNDHCKGTQPEITLFMWGYEGAMIDSHKAKGHLNCWGHL
jgi:fructose/tagatose bisphosphate aldolase